MNDYNINVKFSEEAPVKVAGRWYNPFQRNSYTARVEFPDGFVVLIALPNSAVQHGSDFYLDRVLLNAAAMHMNGTTTGWMYEEPLVKVKGAMCL